MQCGRSPCAKIEYCMRCTGTCAGGRSADAIDRVGTLHPTRPNATLAGQINKRLDGANLISGHNTDRFVTHRHYEVEFGALGPTELPTTPSQ